MEGKDRWSVYLSTRQIEEVGMDFTKVEPLTRYLQNYYDTMCEHDDLLGSLNHDEKEIYQKLIEITDFKAPPEELCDILSNSLGLAWIDHIESKHPELRMVSSVKISQLERELQENISTKSALCKETVLLRARERVIDRTRSSRIARCARALRSPTRPTCWCAISAGAAPPSARNNTAATPTARAGSSANICAAAIYSLRLGYSCISRARYAVGAAVRCAASESSH
jgi:hypothetical protein